MTKNPIKCTFCKKSRSESLKMIVSGNYSICDKCVVLFNGLLKAPTPSTIPVSDQIEKKFIDQLNTIKIREFVDQYVVGQDQAKMAICVSVVNHYKRMLFGEEGSKTLNLDEISKSNLLVTGPSGSGKSFLVATIAKFLDVPFISIDATTLTEAGYIGQNVDTIITRLVAAADGDIAAAENGIVFLDEIDKIAANKSRISSVDGKVSGIQQALLKMVEGTIIPIASDPRRPQKSIEVNTENILFICGGAFIGLNEIVLNRLKKKKGIGFSDKVIPSNLEPEYTTEDFIEFGMIPEFIGRFPLKTYTKELTENELVHILTDAKNNMLTDYQFYFGVDNIEIEFTPDFISNIASIAKKEKTGVRGLKAICDALMLPHMYLIPEYQKKNVAKMTFFGECIDKNILPKIEIFEQKIVAKKSNP